MVRRFALLAGCTLVVLLAVPIASGAIIDQGTIPIPARTEAQTEWILVSAGDIVAWTTTSDTYLNHLAEVRQGFLVESSDGGGLGGCMVAVDDIEFRLRWQNFGAAPLSARDGTVSYTIEDETDELTCISSAEVLAEGRPLPGRPLPSFGLQIAVMALAAAVLIGRRRRP